MEIYFQGEAQGVARPVDPVVNAQLPSLKSVPTPRPESTGINFVELLQQKHQQAEPAKDSSPGKEHDEDKNKE